MIDLDVLNNAKTRLRDRIHQLDAKAEAAYTLGLLTLGEDLSEIVADMLKQEKIISNQFSQMMSEMHEASQQASANMLGAALAMCTINSEKGEE